MLAHNEIFVDLFAGGGGASTGIEAAIRRPVAIAVNHDDAAIAMHAANHPETHHYQEDVWTVDPRVACGSRKVAGLWLSPDCTHHSRAKGGQPRKKDIRSLADVGIRWAEAVRPRFIFLENVEEFQDWGPLDDAGKVIAGRKGEDFRAWCGKLSDFGYHIEYRSLVAADYGAPTSRRRLFLVASLCGPIVWPESTHGKGRSNPWRGASEIIDWSLPCPSIFDRKKPLVDATLRRIARGIQRYVINAADPFVVAYYGQSGAVSITNPLDHHVLVVPFINKHFGGGENGKPPPGIDARKPLDTITEQDHHGLTEAVVSKVDGVTDGKHRAQVHAFLMKYHGGQRGDTRGQMMFEPIRTIDMQNRFAIVMIHGEPYEIVDIGMRMLSPRELFAAQGFPDDYDILPKLRGKPITKTQQIALAGNSVPPTLAEHVVRAAMFQRA